MNDNKNYVSVIDTIDIANKLKYNPVHFGRIARLMRTPLKSLYIYFMRKSSRQKPLACKTIFGINFYGIVPEAVTSLIWRFGVYEPETSLFILDSMKPGDVFLDVGAHFGYFSLLASKISGASGKVISVEAMPATYSMLVNNISKNLCENVVARQFAAGSRAGSVEFRDYGVVNSSLNTFIAARGILDGATTKFDLVNVETKRLDQFFIDEGLPNPTFVKIDAESSEHLVLEGMTRILSGDTPPILLIEMGGGGADEDSRARQIAQSLEVYGYQLCGVENRRLVPVKLTCSVPYFNGIFVPPHKLNTISHSNCSDI
jgi:FkbM family methyltransferase